MKTESAIQKSEGPSELRFEWDNRTVRRYCFQFWFFVLFWIVWAPVTVFVTMLVFQPDTPRVFLIIWCFFGWAGTLGIPYTLFQRTWSEWLTISTDLLICGQRGLFTPKPKCIPISAIQEIGIGHYDPSDRESLVTLNVIYHTSKERKKRHMIGYWLHPALKEELFFEMQAFSEKHQLSMAFQRY